MLEKAELNTYINNSKQQAAISNPQSHKSTVPSSIFEATPEKDNKAKYIGAGTGFLLPVLPKFIEWAKGAKFKDVFKFKALALPCAVLAAAGYVIGTLTGSCLENRKNVTGSTP